MLTGSVLAWNDDIANITAKANGTLGLIKRTCRDVNDVTSLKALGPADQRPISANSGLNLNPGFFFFCSKAFSWMIFSLVCRVSKMIKLSTKKIKLNFRNLVSKLSYLSSNSRTKLVVLTKL